MKVTFEPGMARRCLAAICIGLMAFAAVPAQTAQPAKAGFSPVESELIDKITVASIQNMTKALTADEMEGRGTGQPGGLKAANWIADKYKELGLKPLGDKGSYLQSVNFREVTAVPEDSFFTVGDVQLKYGQDFAMLGNPTSKKTANGEMVFVSYGIQAKSNGIDMIGNLNLAGKVVFLTQGPPPGISEDDWTKKKFGQSIFMNIASAGPAAIVFVSTKDIKQTSDDAVKYMGRRQITMGSSEGGMPEGAPPILFMTSDAAERVFKAAGQSFADAMEAGGKQDFKAMQLKQKAKISARFQSQKVVGHNVVGVLEGSDPQLKAEAILFSAHYDAFGKLDGKIYHGAADNALGTAEMIAVAEAFSKLGTKPKRSLIFLAVTGEEYGLFGSKAWAKSPTWDVKKVAANLNFDGVGTEVYGPVKTVVGFGGEHSTLGDKLKAVADQLGISVIPDPMPDEKIFYRSDHYSFVERGIPSLMLLGAPAGEKEAWIERMKAWEKGDYHEPGDTIKDSWAWEGPETVAEVMAIMAWRISEDSAMPSWLPSSKFGKLERGNTKDLPKED